MEIYDHLSCSICLETLSNPHILSCGHCFCFDCCFFWLKSNHICPQCRSTINAIPIKNIVLFPILDSITDKEYIKRRLDSEKTIKHKLKQLVFFKPALRDLADGVDRCPDCNWEVQDGACTNCDRRFEENDDFNSVSDSVIYSDEERQESVYDSDVQFIDDDGEHVQWPTDEQIQNANDQDDVPVYKSRRNVIHSSDSEDISGHEKSLDEMFSNVSDDDHSIQRQKRKSLEEMFSDDHSIQRQKRKSLEEMFSDSDQQERGDFATDYKERREMIREMVSDSDQQERGDFSTDSEHEMEKGNQSIQHHARNRGDFSSDDQDEEDIPLYHSTKRYTTLTTTLKSPTLATRQESREVLQEYSDSFEQEEDLEELEFHQQQEHYTKDSPKNYSKDEKEDIQHKFFGQARDQTIKDLKEKEILNSHIRFKSSSVSPEQLRKGKSKDLGGEVIKKKKHKKKHKKKKETVNPLKRMFEDVQDQNKRVKM